MRKSKGHALNLFLIGMVIVAAGCFLPLSSSKIFGGRSSAFDVITSGGSSERFLLCLALLRESFLLLSL